MNEASSAITSAAKELFTVNNKWQKKNENHYCYFLASSPFATVPETSYILSWDILSISTGVLGMWVRALLRQIG